jgi:hypothetical protein
MGVSLNHPSPQTISVNAKVPILDDKHAEKKTAVPPFTWSASRNLGEAREFLGIGFHIVFLADSSKNQLLDKSAGGLNPCDKDQEGNQLYSSYYPVPGWWFQPLWKIWKSVGMIIPNIWKNKTCSKPPTSSKIHILHHVWWWNHCFGLGHSEVVIIYPESWISSNNPHEILILGELLVASVSLPPSDPSERTWIPSGIPSPGDLLKRIPSGCVRSTSLAHGNESFW